MKNQYKCEYCNNSFSSYNTYMYTHECKFTEANKIMGINKKISEMLDGLLTIPRKYEEYMHYRNLQNKVAHDTLMIVNKIMNQ